MLFRPFSETQTATLKEHGIVDDVLKGGDGKTEGALLVKYPGEAGAPGEAVVLLGGTLLVAGTQAVPQVAYTQLPTATPIVPTDTFTLVLTDPDAPTRGDKKWSEYCHWVVTDLTLTPTDAEVPESLTTLIDVSKGRTLVEYMGPGPPEGSGPHRYVFLLYKTPSGLTAPPDRPTWGTGVPGSGVAEWIGTALLVGINFFFAENK